MGRILRQSVPFVVLLSAAAAGIVLFASPSETGPSPTDSLSTLCWMDGVAPATAAAAAGEARIDGTIGGDETGLTIAGLRCIACSSVLECPHRDRKGRRRWKVERSESSIAPFVVRDDTGTLRVDASAVRIVDDSDMVSTVPARTAWGNCRSTELAITDGRSISVVGCVTGTGDARVLGACGDRQAVLARSADRARRVLRGAAGRFAYLLLIPLPALLAWGFVATRRPDRSRRSA